MKFKLIKTYPGSSELGTIIYEAHNSLWYYARPNNEYLQHSVETIKSNPEFWQPETEWVEISNLTNSPKGSRQ